MVNQAPNAQPLTELSAVDWASMEHAYGSAVDVPDMLQRLVAAGSEARAEARAALLHALNHQGVRRFESTLAAVPFLVGLLADPASPERGKLARLLAEFAVGDSWWFQHDGFHPQLQPDFDHCSRPKASSHVSGGGVHIRTFPEPGQGHDMRPGSQQLAIYEAIGAGVETYAELCDVGADPATRCGAAYLLAWLTPWSGSAAPALARLTEDTDPIVRATGWLALSHATKRDEDRVQETVDRLRSAWRNLTDPLERRAAALALVRIERPEDSDLVRPTLRDGIREGLRPVRQHDHFPWERVDGAAFVFCTLYLGSAPPDRDEVLDAAVAGFGRVQDPDEAADLARWLCTLSVPDLEIPTPTPRDFEPPELQTLSALAAHGPAWHYADVSELLRIRGLPTTQAQLVAWLRSP